MRLLTSVNNVLLPILAICEQYCDAYCDQCSAAHSEQFCAAQSEGCSHQRYLAVIALLHTLVS